MVRRPAIGLATSFISGRFFEQVVRGIQRIARQHQLDLVVVHGTPEHAAATGVARRHIDGWLVLTYLDGIERLALQGKPIVTISCLHPSGAFPAVLPDNRGGAEAALLHLLDQGHRHIAFAGDVSIGDIAERYETYRAVLAARGIPFDPALVALTGSPLADDGVAAARQLAGRPWTAALAGNDWTAIGMLRELQARGYRIPEDAALVGFDDIPEAQAANPPLSTVRQDCEELGASAARLLVELLAGQPAPDAPRLIPTTLVARESSGRHAAPRHDPPGPAAAPGPFWQDDLARQLAGALLPALPADAPPSQLWPEVDSLVRMVAAAIDGPAPAADHRQLQAIFASPPILHANAEILVAMLRIVEQAGGAACDGRPDAGAVRERLAALIDQLQVEAMRSYRRRQAAAGRTLGEVLHGQYAISRQLLQGAPQHLDWLAETQLELGCLGLWGPPGDPPLLSIAGSYQRSGPNLLRLGTTADPAQFPPIERLAAGKRSAGGASPGSGMTWLILRVATPERDWGLLAVAGPLISNDPWLEDSSVNSLETCCGFLAIALEREALQESLRYAAEREAALGARVRDLGCPVVPVAAGVALLPLSGGLEAETAPELALAALHAAGDPQHVLLDVTARHPGALGHGAVVE
ncbi:MAG TPA: substrate-binding domain-containing protein, partial [Herpetosiphonaceae bacterium]